MNPEDKKEEEGKSNPETKKESPQGGKLQRKLKFKTLDGKIQNLECDYDIKISELKKKLAEIYKIEPIRQRLLNKGKQFKDDEYLDKLVDKDDTTIHLVFRSEEDVKRMQVNAQNNNNTSNQNQNQNQNTQNVNPFQNILSIVNSDQIRNITNNIVNQLFNPSTNSNNNNNATNANNQSQTQTINIGNTQFQTLNVGESLNLTNSPLHPIVQHPNISGNPPPLNLNEANNTNNQNTNNQNTNNNNNAANIEINKNNYSSQFPITPSNTDKKYEMHLKNIEKELNLADEIASKKIEPRIPLPLLNTTQNVFTAMSRSLRKYVIVNQNLLCHLMHLADIMEREQFLTNSETRMTGNKLLDQAYKALLHISKASKDLSNVIKSSNFNNAPNTGYIGIICSEIGMQTTSIPIEVGEINTDNILASLSGNNNNNTQNSNNANNNNNNLGNILLRTINNNNYGNQGQGNIQGISAELPVSIVEVTVDNNGNINTNTTPNMNLNNNQTNNSTSNTNNNTNNQNNFQKENDKEKKEKESKKDEQKDKENILKANNDKKGINNQNINANNTTNNQNVNNNQNTQNNTQGAGANNNFNNLFGNMMNQLMTPENLNSIAGAVGSMLNNNGSNQSGQGGNSMGGLFGNLISNLMGSLGDESDEEQENNEQPSQQTETQGKKELNTPKENQAPTNNNTNEKDEKEKKDIINNINDKKLLIKKLVESPQLRRETKINDESKIGEKMDPNIEFAPVGNDIISNLTVQDVFNMYNLNFTGLCRLRKEIQQKYFSDKSKNDEIIKNVIELLCERFILAENQIDKLFQDKEFNMEEFFNKYLKEILNMFIDDNEVNKTDSNWEDKFRKLVLNMFINLINEVKEVYESGEDGAKTFIEFNILTLIENFIGQKYLTLIQSYDEDIFNKYVENLFTFIKAQDIKNKCQNENNNQNAETPNLLSIDEIFKIATKDKERLEKEDKEKTEEERKKKYSDFYYLTSLFKN